MMISMVRSNDKDDGEDDEKNGADGCNYHYEDEDNDEYESEEDDEKDGANSPDYHRDNITIRMRTINKMISRMALRVMMMMVMKKMKKMMSRMALMAGRPSNDGCGCGADQESCAPLILLLRSGVITLKL